MPKNPASSENTVQKAAANLRASGDLSGRARAGVLARAVDAFDRAAKNTPRRVTGSK